MDYDHLLIERFQAGDREAFSLLVIKYKHRVMRLVSLFICDASEAENVVLDAFCKAFRTLPNVGASYQFCTWIYRIAINLSKSHPSRHERRSSPFDVIGGVSTPNNFPADRLPDEEMLKPILVALRIEDAISRALETLPFDSLAALVLREVDGLTYKEISTILTCPVYMVRKHISFAREEISGNLSKCQ